jgi:hypothetical protein
MAEGYTSWVVRAWSRDELGTVRLTIEEVRSGQLVELWGEDAAEIEGVISAAFAVPARGDAGHAAGQGGCAGHTRSASAPTARGPSSA